jgi:hypothetical protein
VRRWATALLALTLGLGACGGDDGGDERVVDETIATTTTQPPNDAVVRLNQLLVTEADLSGEGFEAVVTARPFAAQRATRVRLCEEDLRAELGVVNGRQSRFTDGAVEVSHTVTSGGDVADLVERFRTIVQDCPGSWLDPPLPTGGGPVRREITGPYPLPADLGVDGTGAVIRSLNGVGSTDTVVIVLTQGALVSSLSISGPVGSGFDVVDPAIEAAAERLRSVQSPAGP